MYDFVDRPITSLDPGGRFLIWTMRSWVKCMYAGRCPCTTIGPAFAKWKMIAGLPHFHMMMMVFNREARATFRFGPLECNRVREHEAIIISLIHGMRMSRPDTVRVTLALIVNDDAITNLMTAVAAMGRAMADAEIFPSKPGYCPETKGCTNE